jgi:hypothetical protein
VKYSVVTLDSAPKFREKYVLAVKSEMLIVRHETLPVQDATHAEIKVTLHRVVSSI